MTGKFSKLDGTPESGTVTFVAPSLMSSPGDNEQITPGRFVGTLTSEGVLSLPVYATDDPDWNPNGWSYRVIVNLSQYRETFNVLIPYTSSGGTLDMADIAPSIVVSPGVMYAPLAHTHPEYEGGGGGVAGVTSVNGRSGVVTLAKSDVGLTNVDNTSDANKPLSTAATTALAGKADLSGGKIPTSQIPAVAMVEYLGTSANQAAMLAKTGQPGDWTNRTDLGTSWQITGADPTQLSNWTQLLYPTAPVTTVAGRTGAVVLEKADVGLGNVDNTADSAKPVSTAQQTALNAKPDVYAWTGSAYALVSTGDIYVGPTDPGAVGEGSIWIDTDA
jgi:hypothetical protein